MAYKIKYITKVPVAVAAMHCVMSNGDNIVAFLNSSPRNDHAWLYANAVMIWRLKSLKPISHAKD